MTQKERKLLMALVVRCRETLAARVYGTLLIQTMSISRGEIKAILAAVHAMNVSGGDHHGHGG